MSSISKLCDGCYEIPALADVTYNKSRSPYKKARIAAGFFQTPKTQFTLAFNSPFKYRWYIASNEIGLIFEALPAVPNAS